MASAPRVGLDSDAMTFLAEAMSIGYDLAFDSSEVAAERVAMLRISYCPFNRPTPRCLQAVLSRRVRRENVPFPTVFCETVQSGSP